MIVPARFWAKVDTSTGCWLWTAGTSTNGYGRFRIDNHTVYAHRYAYEQVNGPIPAGYDTDHICRNRLCVNPDHLRVTTRKQNMENHNGDALPTNHTSGVRGVTWHRRARKWMVQVRHHETRHYGGLFTDLDEARQAAIELRNQLHTHNNVERQRNATTPGNTGIND